MTLLSKHGGYSIKILAKSYEADPKLEEETRKEVERRSRQFKPAKARLAGHMTEVNDEVTAMLSDPMYHSYLIDRSENLKKKRMEESAFSKSHFGDSLLM